MPSIVKTPKEDQRRVNKSMMELPSKKISFTARGQVEKRNPTAVHIVEANGLPGFPHGVPLTYQKSVDKPKVLRKVAKMQGASRARSKSVSPAVSQRNTISNRGSVQSSISRSGSHLRKGKSRSNDTKSELSQRKQKITATKHLATLAEIKRMTARLSKEMGDKCCSRSASRPGAEAKAIA